MEYNLADIFELAVDNYPDREYLVVDGKRLSYSEMDKRANQLAHALSKRGIGKGDHVGIYALNCIEWVETLWAVFKLRAVWININYRYVEDELSYIFANANLKALIVQRSFLPRLNRIPEALQELHHILFVEDGSDATPSLSAVNIESYEASLKGESSDRDFEKRSGDDIYMLFTGGSTGMPKAVVWRHADVFFALGGGIDQSTGEVCHHPQQVIDRGAAFQMTMLPAAPLMHGASQWAVMGGAFEGRRIILQSQFNAQQIWQAVQQENINCLFITGDAMAQPLIDALEGPSSKTDISSLFVVASSAVVFSSRLKEAFLQKLPNLILIDSIGSSETGGTGMLMAQKGQTQMKGGPTVKPGHGSVILDMKTLEPLPAGSDQIGMLARSGFIPLGYYNDAEKTAATFVTTKDGTRYALSGDHALHEADGSITMLGRGSGCINSGGEKIFPEEVESAVKSHADVYDVIVVGIDDQRWGSKVCAVVQFCQTAQTSLLELQEHCRSMIAGYKIPRALVAVQHIERAPSGKPDYRWAKSVADNHFADQNLDES